MIPFHHRTNVVLYAPSSSHVAGVLPSRRASFTALSSDHPLTARPLETSEHSSLPAPHLANLHRQHTILLSTRLPERPDTVTVERNHRAKLTTSHPSIPTRNAPPSRPYLRLPIDTGAQINPQHLAKPEVNRHRPNPNKQINKTLRLKTTISCLIATLLRRNSPT